MPDSQEPNQVNNNDLSNAQFGGGFINAENVNAGRIGGDIWNIFFGQQTTPVGNPARPKNERILLAAVKEEVTARLRQSLHNAVLINLGKESQPQQVKRPWDAEIKIGLKPPEPLLDTTTILEVFDSPEIAGKLLILGAPGSGKTTTQLELAQALVSRAEEQPDYPVPILFNLSSWKDNRQSITDWLVAELKSKYGVSKKLGQEWLNNRQLLPLLDALDEIEPQRQELCVYKINESLASETRPLCLVICSRIEEYSNYATQLQLNGAIYLQTLTNNQIRDYLTTINYIELWSTISRDLDLLELVKTPLLLSITILVSQKISVEEWQKLTSTPDRIQYLLDAYIGQMLTRDFNSRAYFKNKTPNAKQIQIWLIWFARQMQQESKTEFLIEEMQPSLLKNKISKIIYNLVVWGIIQTLISVLIIGLIYWLIAMLIIGLKKDVNAGLNYWLEHGVIVGLKYGLLIGLTVGILNGLFGKLIDRKLEKTTLFNIYLNKTIIKWLIYGLIFGLLFGLIDGYVQFLKTKLDSISGLIYRLIFGLISGLISDKLEAIEVLRFSFNKFLVGLICGLVTGLIFGKFGLTDILQQNFLINIGLVFGLIFGLVWGFQGIEIENKVISNQGIWQSAKNTVKLSTFVFLCSTIVIFLIQQVLHTKNSLLFSLVSGLLVALLVGIPRSGTPVIKHFSLRLILYFNGYIPWNYARFLDYCTERMLLQRVGGRYRFIHKLLQDHFAQMEFRRD
ncbi:MAG: NACHT domain-containing protein [Nostoc sp. ChiSLP01]|nr:NACHT domain-containing protein [Nostoc sp. CmiSLP01]MDZ8286351.1 NACHT domain-containing protein [Nostoc sp. ChiSLP01]